MRARSKDKRTSIATVFSFATLLTPLVSHCEKTGEIRIRERRAQSGGFRKSDNNLDKRGTTIDDQEKNIKKQQKQEEVEATSKKEQTQELSAAKEDQINIWTKKRYQGRHK
jgi:hypothetical protein